MESSLSPGVYDRLCQFIPPPAVHITISPGSVPREYQSCSRIFEYEFMLRMVYVFYNSSKVLTVFQSCQ